jgi:hypothetical protein
MSNSLASLNVAQLIALAAAQGVTLTAITPRTGRAGSGKYSGMVITKLTETNPRKPGTHGANAWNSYQSGITYEQYRALGLGRNHLQWDIDHKFVSLALPVVTATEQSAPAAEPVVSVEAAVITTAASEPEQVIAALETVNPADLAKAEKAKRQGKKNR